jgi:hypothetical protein
MNTIFCLSSVPSRKVQLLYFHTYSVAELKLWACAIAACRRNRRDCAAAAATKRFINSRIIIILWHVDPLLGSNRETTRQRPVLSNGP